MYDIVKEIWKNPGAQYSPYPIWVWNDKPDADVLVSQLDEFHKKGIDGVIIRPQYNIEEKEYLDSLAAVLEAAKKRRMLVILSDCAINPEQEVKTKDKRLAPRRLYAKPVDGEIPEGEELLFRIYVKLSGGKLDDVKLDSCDGYDGYNLLLGYNEEKAGGYDFLNPYAAETLIKNVYEKYYSALREYFGTTVIGFYTCPPADLSDSAHSDSVPWSYNLIENWLVKGGDFTSLAALLFKPKADKTRREAKFILDGVLREKACEAYIKPIAKWCREHGVGLMGCPEEYGNTDFLSCFDVPGAKFVSGQDKTGLKYIKAASDTARHMGISKSSAELELNGDETPDELMLILNRIFSFGGSMIIPGDFYSNPDKAEQIDSGRGFPWWSEYRKIAGYVKRMSWLNSTGTNNPACAVLCSPDYIPNGCGYSFNYLSVGDFMDKAHVHEGKVQIDRYEYSIILVDSRLRLNADIVKKLGKYVTEGGLLYRGTDFEGFLSGHVKNKSYFDSDKPGDVRVVHMTKSGCPFFALINDGEEDISGSFVTDLSLTAELFDPFTGKSSPMYAELADGGFSYKLRVPSHSAVIVGMNPDGLVALEKDDREELHLSEIAALSEGRMEFTVRTDTVRVVLSAENVYAPTEVKINGENAGMLIFRPFELDITPFVHAGINSAEIFTKNVIVNKNQQNESKKYEGCVITLYGN